LTASRAEADLLRQASTERWFEAHRPDVVVVAAAKVGGIHANNTLPRDFLMENLAIEMNTIDAAFRFGTRKLLFLGSSCIYPRLAEQPIREEALLTGPLEPTNEWYAIAKIAGIKMCQAYRKQDGADFISLMPTNLFGPGDNYHPEHSHVVGALLRRFHEAATTGAPEVIVWGTGAPRREFLFVDDLADACVVALENYSGDGPLNCGVGKDVTITEFAHTIAKVTGYTGRIVFDRSKPDGMPRKLMDNSKITALGWRPKTGLEEGLRMAYADYVGGGGRFVASLTRARTET
jgi:GDP-L-fucose synthase